VTSANEPMPAEVRRDRILALLQDEDYVRISQLAEDFGVSVVTIRADLDYLGERKLVRRVRGGASQLAPEPHAEPSFELSLGSSALEKAAIANAAAQIVRSGESIVIDSGTTTTFLTKALVARRELCDLVVFTNSMTIAHELEPAIPRFSVILTGGTLRPAQHALVDPLAGRILDQIHANIVFLSCNGMHPESGATNISLSDAEVKQRMLRAASRCILLADSSKLGRIELVPICGVADIDLLITGEQADPAQVLALREQGLTVDLAPDTAEP
jgi:DeoR family transcriptional regulator, aga operon transcriptional repressor